MLNNIFVSSLSFIKTYHLPHAFALLKAFIFREWRMGSDWHDKEAKMIEQYQVLLVACWHTLIGTESRFARAYSCIYTTLT